MMNRFAYLDVARRIFAVPHRLVRGALGLALLVVATAGTAVGQGVDIVPDPQRHLIDPPGGIRALALTSIPGVEWHMIRINARHYGAGGVIVYALIDRIRLPRAADTAPWLEAEVQRLHQDLGLPVPQRVVAPLRYGPSKAGGIVSELGDAILVYPSGTQSIAIEVVPVTRATQLVVFGIGAPVEDPAGAAQAAVDFSEVWVPILSAARAP